MMDRETQAQLDEYFVDRELTDLRENIIRLLVEGLDGHDPECLCHEWRRFQIIDMRKRERKLRRLVNLPEIDLSTFEEWRYDDEDTVQQWREEEEAEVRTVQRLIKKILLSETFDSDVSEEQT
jgi:hypothetical protein